MWQLALVQGPNVTMYSHTGDIKRENMGEFQKALAYMLSNGWEPFSAGETNLVVIWFRRRVS